MNFWHFFYSFFHFLGLKLNVKNEKLEKLILVRESENVKKCCNFWSYFLQKKKLFSLSYGQKWKKLRKWKKGLFFPFPLKAWGGGVYYDAPCIYIVPFQRFLANMNVAVRSFRARYIWFCLLQHCNIRKMSILITQ